MKYIVCVPLVGDENLHLTFLSPTDSMDKASQLRDALIRLAPSQAKFVRSWDLKHWGKSSVIYDLDENVRHLYENEMLPHVTDGPRHDIELDFPRAYVWHVGIRKQFGRELALDLC